MRSSICKAPHYLIFEASSGGLAGDKEIRYLTGAATGYQNTDRNARFVANHQQPL